MNWFVFFTVLAQVESGGDLLAVGDLGYADKAYGRYQVRQPMLDDVRRLTGVALRAEVDAANGSALTEWAIHHYLFHWSSVHGQALTYEVAARIYNGGPRGWDRVSTLPFWRRFELELVKHERDEE